MRSKYSSAQGYGFWCNDSCAEAKIAAGIPPLGAGRAAKVYDAQGNLLLGQAATASANRQSEAWSPVQTAGVAVAALLTIGIIGVILVKAKKKRAA